MEVQADKTLDSNKKPYKLAFIIEGCVLVFVLILLAISISKNHGSIYQDIQQHSATNTQKPSQPDITISQAQIDSWPYYIDEKDGYMIKHPSYIDFDGDHYYLTGDDKRHDTPDGVGPNVSVYVESIGSIPQHPNQKQITINNAKGVQEDGEMDYYLQPLDGRKKVVEIRAEIYDPFGRPIATKERADKIDAIVHAMIPTFKFLEPNISSDSLKSTFINKKYEYSFQYPIIWGYTDSDGTKNPNIIDESDLIFGPPLSVGALYVQDNLKNIGSQVDFTTFSVRVEKPTKNDEHIITNSQNCGTTGIPYELKNATAVIFENTSCGIGGELTLIDILHNNYFYEIQTTLNRSTLDPILKTFAFTD